MLEGQFEDGLFVRGRKIFKYGNYDCGYFKLNKLHGYGQKFRILESTPDGVDEKSTQCNKGILYEGEYHKFPRFKKTCDDCFRQKVRWNNPEIREGIADVKDDRLRKKYLQRIIDEDKIEAFSDDEDGNKKYSVKCDITSFK